MQPGRWAAWRASRALRAPRAPTSEPRTVSRGNRPRSRLRRVRAPARSTPPPCRAAARHRRSGRHDGAGRAGVEYRRRGLRHRDSSQPRRHAGSRYRPARSRGPACRRPLPDGLRVADGLRAARAAAALRAVHEAAALRAVRASPSAGAVRAAADLRAEPVPRGDRCRRAGAPLRAGARCRPVGRLGTTADHRVPADVRHRGASRDVGRDPGSRSCLRRDGCRGRRRGPDPGCPCRCRARRAGHRAFRHRGSPAASGPAARVPWVR